LIWGERLSWKLREQDLDLLPLVASISTNLIEIDEE